ncbi:MAG TPA: hypothetical protein VHP30_13385 [Ignavibacteriales bacterium]|nr:hypothetical protein [Ignavibacteriales bacterium]
MMPANFNPEDVVISDLALVMLKGKDFYSYVYHNINNEELKSYFIGCFAEKELFVKEILKEIREDLRLYIEMQYKTTDGIKIPPGSGLHAMVEEGLRLEKETVKMYERAFKNELSGRLKTKLAGQYYGARQRSLQLEELKNVEKSFEVKR